MEVTGERPPGAGLVLLEQAGWTARAAEHAARADALTAGHRERAARGERHPVQDFLFTYYAMRPGALRRWHPGTGVALAGAAAAPRSDWPGYRAVSPGGVAAVAVDAAELRGRRGAELVRTRALLRATAARAPRLGCFGMHEWAMLYRARPEQVRHPGRPLRLGAAGTDAVVERVGLACTHVDAYRFFTAAARPRNPVALTRHDQVAQEQPGCLHAGMDLYRWAYRLGPATPGELLLACFELAHDARALDMAASPYDLRDLGYPPVPVETAAGRAEYARRQRDLAERAEPLRRSLLAVLDAVLDGG